MSWEWGERMRALYWAWCTHWSDPHLSSQDPTNLPLLWFVVHSVIKTEATRSLTSNYLANARSGARAPGTPVLSRSFFPNSHTCLSEFSFVFCVLCFVFCFLCFIFRFPFWSPIIDQRVKFTIRVFFTINSTTWLRSCNTNRSAFNPVFIFLNLLHWENCAWMRNILFIAKQIQRFLKFDKEAVDFF